MSDLKAKMHQNWFPLGLCPSPRWGSLQHCPDPLARFKGPTSKGKGREGRGGPSHWVDIGTHTAHVVTCALNAEAVCRLCQLIMNEINSRVRQEAWKTSWNGPTGKSSGFPAGQSATGILSYLVGFGQILSAPVRFGNLQDWTHPYITCNCPRYNAVWHQMPQPSHATIRPPAGPLQ